MRRGVRRKARKKGLITDIPLTPLIDTALTLLIIFMITAPMMHNAIKVQLPQGNAKEDAHMAQELIVYIDKDGNRFVNGTPFDTDELIVSDLKERVGDQSNKMVYVKADQKVDYGSVVTLVDKIKVIGGIKYVALATAKYT